MIYDPEEELLATHSMWTIARIQSTLTSPVLIPRFLLDLSNDPEHRVTEVFTAWRSIAATIDARSGNPPARTPATD